MVAVFIRRGGWLSVLGLFGLAGVGLAALVGTGPGGADRNSLQLAAGFGLLLVLAGLIMVQINAQRAALARDGQPAMATVTRVVRQNGWMQLHYGFAGPDGRRYVGKSRPRRDHAADRPAIGAALAVRHLPRQPRINAPETDLPR